VLLLNSELYDSLEMIDFAMAEVLEESMTNEEEDVNDLLLLEELRQVDTGLSEGVYINIYSSGILIPPLPPT
jgi:hypothetical protein